MNKQAFRNRMQQLKQYREQNPGKTYLDFKKYADGGKTKDINTERQQQQDIPTLPLKLQSWITPKNAFKWDWSDIKTKLPKVKGFGFTSALDLIDMAADEYEIQHSTNPQQTRRYRDYQTRSAIGLEDQGLEKLYKTTPKMADGGEIPPTKPIIPEDPIPYKGTLYKDRYGKKYTLDQVNDYYDNSTDEIDRFTGKPLIRGLKPLVDLEDAANVTPLGDAISAYDAYTAAKNDDWSGFGLAMLGLLPYVPSKIYASRGISKPKVHREIPKVNRQIEENAKNALLDEKQRYIDQVIKTRNETYDAIEQLTEDPAYLRRAEEVLDNYGDDYIRSYADMMVAYNEDPSILPYVAELDRSIEENYSKSASMAKEKDGYALRINRDVVLPYRTYHELNHYSDLLKSGTTDVNDGNKMFKKMQKDLTKNIGDGHDAYMRMPTEQKAHMNTLREYLHDNKFISQRDEKVTPQFMQKVMDYLDYYNIMHESQRAAKQFKNINTYTKWFNQVPLLGVGAMGIYSYENKDSK